MDKRASSDLQETFDGKKAFAVESAEQAVHNLWFYAFGALSSEENSQVQQWLVRNGQAQMELSVIKEYLTDLLDEDERNLMQGFIQSFHAMLDKSRRNLVNFTGAFVRMKEGLILSHCEQGWNLDFNALRTESLSDKKEEGLAGSKVRQKRLVIRGPEGSRISAVHTPAGRVDIDLEIPSATQEGWVTVFRLVPVDSGLIAENIGIKGKFTNGHACLRDCPDGFLRFCGPHDYSIDVYLGCAAI